MRKFLKALRAVLWASIGLGGRRADADERVEGTSFAIVVVLALVLTVGLVGGLIALARLAAS